MPSAFVPGALEPRQACLHSFLSIHASCLSSRSGPIDFEAGIRDSSSKNSCADSYRSPNVHSLEEPTSSRSSLTADPTPSGPSACPETAEAEARAGPGQGCCS